MKLIKPLLSAILIISVLAGVSAKAAGLESSHSFQKLQASLCENAQLDQVVKLRYNLRQARTHIRSIYPEVSCDGETLLSIAMDNNANQMVSYLKLKADLTSNKSPARLATN